PTQHVRLLAWVRDCAELSQPDRVEWVDGSAAEWTRITDQLVAAGTFIRLNEDTKPNSFWAASDPADVARVEDRTFICSRDQRDAGPTNNWMDPDDMKAILTERFRGSMRGRTMYVIPYCGTLPQRRNVDREYFQPIIKVLAKCALLHHGHQITMRGR